MAKILLLNMFVKCLSEASGSRHMKRLVMGGGGRGTGTGTGTWNVRNGVRRHPENLRIGSCLACVYRVMDGHGKFG